jgi:hypothetical protein
VRPPAQSTTSPEAVDRPNAPEAETKAPQVPDAASRDARNAAPADATPAPVPEHDVSKPSEAPITEAERAAEMGSRPSHDVTNDAPPMTPRQQVMAAVAVAEQLTTTGAMELKAMRDGRANDATNKPAGDPAETSAIGPDDSALVALVVTGPEIKSLTELANKDVAIDKPKFGAGRDVRAALVAAGAVAVRLSDGDTPAIDRLIRNEVPAAVVTLVSPGSADTFPSLVDLNVFKVPLSPVAVEQKQRDGDPPK